jgi:hypothetical protein
MSIYFVQGEDYGPVKIGFTSHVDPETRLSALQCGSPVKLILRAAVQGTVAEEAELHRRFAAQRLHGEWFIPCAAMEQIAGVRLRVNGERFYRYHRGQVDIDPRPLRSDQTLLVRALADMDRYVTAARLRRTLHLSEDRALGTTLYHLRTRGWVKSRFHTIFRGRYEQTVREWAHYSVTET